MRRYRAALGIVIFTTGAALVHPVDRWSWLLGIAFGAAGFVIWRASIRGGAVAMVDAARTSRYRPRRPGSVKSRPPLSRLRTLSNRPQAGFSLDRAKVRGRAVSVTIHDLIALYAGEPEDGGGWVTTPHPTVPLAVEICRQARPEGMLQLLQIVYGAIPESALPTDEVEMLEFGFRHWWRTGRRALAAA